MKTEIDVQVEKLNKTKKTILTTLKAAASNESGAKTPGTAKGLEKTYDETKESIAKGKKELNKLEFDLVKQERNIPNNQLLPKENKVNTRSSVPVPVKDLSNAEQSELVAESPLDQKITEVKLRKG